MVLYSNGHQAFCLMAILASSVDNVEALKNQWLSNRQAGHGVSEKCQTSDIQRNSWKAEGDFDAGQWQSQKHLPLKRRR
jgi:hypothetical protein